MNKYLLTLTLLAVGVTALCQQHPQFGTFHTIFQTGGFRDLTVQVGFKLSTCDSKNLRGYSYYRTFNLRARKGASLSFKFDYKTCDGKIGTEFVTVDMSKAGINEYIGNWFSGYEVTSVAYDITFRDPLADQAESLKDRLEELQTAFYKEYNWAANELLKRINDASKRSPHAATLDVVKGAFEQAYSNALKHYKYADGDAMSKDVDEASKQKDRLENAIGDINKAIADQENETSNIAKNGNGSGQTTIATVQGTTVAGGATNRATANSGTTTTGGGTVSGGRQAVNDAAAAAAEQKRQQDAYNDSVSKAATRARVATRQAVTRENREIAAAASLAIIGAAALMKDHWTDNPVYFRYSLGLGWENLPVLGNVSDKTVETDAASYPYAGVGMELGIFNNRGVSLHLSPFFNFGLEIAGGTSGSHLSYGGNLEVTAGRKNTSLFKLFASGGYMLRSGSWHFDQDASAASVGISTYTNRLTDASYNYSVIRFGGGVMFHFIDETEEKESWIKPGIFLERPSFFLSNTKPVMVGDLRALVLSFIELDFSYSQNYFIGGTSNSHSFSKRDNQNYFNISLIKTGIF